MPGPLLERPHITASGAVVGRPRKQPPPFTPPVIRQTPQQDIAQRLKQLAAEPRSMANIADQLGTSSDTLRRWLREYPALAWMFEAGRAALEYQLASAILSDAADRERPAVNCFFLGKIYCGWREDAPPEQPSRVNIVVNLPGALTAADYAKTVTVDAAE